MVDTHVIVFAGLLIPAAAPGDRFGRKGVLLTGLGLFGTGSGGVCAGRRTRREEPSGPRVELNRGVPHRSPTAR